LVYSRAGDERDKTEKRRGIDESCEEMAEKLVKENPLYFNPQFVTLEQVKNIIQLVKARNDMGDIEELDLNKVDDETLAVAKKLQNKSTFLFGKSRWIMLA
jgi:hypothetical protein